MLKPEVLTKIKKLQLHTKRVLSNNRLGDYKSRQRGYGLEFDQIRGYELGDDVRFIDWKSSSRMNQLLVKQYLHESNKTVMIALDISASLHYGSTDILKIERAREIATVLAFASLYGKAAVGLILFSHDVELSIPPKQGRSQVQRIVDTIWNAQSLHKGATSLKAPLEYLARLKRKDSLAFLISDFIDQQDCAREMQHVSRLYDLIALRCLDMCEKSMPFEGLIQVIDPESQQTMLMKVGTKESERIMKERLTKQENFFTKHGVDYFDCALDSSYIDSLIGFFSKRLRRG